MIFSGHLNRQRLNFKFTLVNYIGFNGKGMLLAGGCGGTIVLFYGHILIEIFLYLLRI